MALRAPDAAAAVIKNEFAYPQFVIAGCSHNFQLVTECNSSLIRQEKGSPQRGRVMAEQIYQLLIGSGFAPELVCIMGVFWVTPTLVDKAQ
jgi:hypothetical protein